MAARKSINLLPSVFQTDANKKFLAATVDQLIQDPQLRKLHGYIGRQFAPTFKSTDSYVIENDIDRQNYQLEPSTLIRDEQDNTVFFSSYIDFINKIEYYGGLVNDHSRLFSSEYYTFDPSISFDKFVNFAQYYWLPNGPSAVQINTSGVELRDSFTVARNTSTKKYNFTSKALTKDALVLARGGTYTFQVNQPGVPFWIQTELGVDGRVSSATTLNARDVLGVTNNGEDLGEITFNVPQKDAQDRFIRMETVYNVEYATPSAFKDLHNQTITDFLEKYPQYAGITGTIDGKTLIFVDQELTDDPWIVEGRDDNVSIGYDKGDMVPENERYGVWKIQTINLECKLELTNAGSANIAASLGDYITIPSIGANVRVVADSTVYANAVGNVSIDSITAISNVAVATGNVYLNGTDTGLTVSNKFVVRALTLDVVVDRLINLFWVQDVAFDQKVYVKYGVGNANREFYKEFDGIFHRVPLLSSLLDTLYIQDSLDPNIYATIKIVDFTNFTIDVENDILGRINYTSPNGVTFTSGLKIEFGEDVIPANYQSRQYYVENVGDKIRLVDTELLITPETFNDELAINYPLQRIVLDTPTVDNILAGSIISFGGYTVTTNTIIPTGSTNITTLDDVSSITKGMLASGTGIAAGSIVYDIYPDSVFPDYITIKRDAIDLNAWSRNNRWFHIDVIKSAAEFNNENLIFDQKLRAQRPIVQFEGDLQLFNNGRVGKPHIDVLDTDFNDAFSTLEGQPLTSDSTIPSTSPGLSGIDSSAFGTEIFDGLRVIFASDADPLVKDKIYIIRLVQFTVDGTGEPSGPYRIKLELAEDSEPRLYDTLVVKAGKYKGSQWWYNGDTWIESQQKTGLQQDPLFDVFDNNDVSLSDITVYPRTDFAGSKIFGYDRSNSIVTDSVLGFPLKYRSFQSQGDILFANYFNTETFTYVVGAETITENVNIGFFRNIIDRENVIVRNTWKTVKEYSKQYQIFKFIYNGTNNLFTLDVTPAESSTIPRVRVYQNETYLREDQWTISYANEISLLTTLTAGDVINVEVYSFQSSYQGAYQVPLNLDLNAQNLDLTNLTLGQVRNHLVSLNRNSRDVIGNILGPCNLRDIEIKAQGGSILQHSAPLPYAQLFLLDEQANLIESVRYAQREYSKFRNKFFELSTTLGGIDVNDPIGGVDKILAEINKNKNSSFPWFYSDMIPYGTLKNEITYTIFDPLISSYEITQVFSTEMLSNNAVLVYLTPSTKTINTIDTTTDGVTLRLESVFGVFPGMIISGPDLTVLEQVNYIYVEEIIDDFTVTLSGRVTIAGDKELTFTGVKQQLTLGFDYTFDTDRPAVTFNTNNITLGVDDIITVVEYQNTDGCYIPETPTKLGVYPKYIPETFLDDTYRNPIKVIRGHDGSLTPSFGDYRDAFLLELELRIYNNIKLPDTGTYADIFASVPGKFRDSEYTYQELWQVLSKTFLSWVGNNKVDYSTNSTFLANDPFTWNYSNCVDVIDGEYLPGSWRACYMYFYDTFYPHTRPWEMLGFATKPDWWEDFYGPGPYTGGNKLLWDDLEAGLIRFGPRSLIDDGYGQGVDIYYVRPGLSQVIPVDENGFLLSPSAILAKSVNPTRSAGAWSVGQLGPVEYAWRSSVDFPFATQIGFALTKPAVYFGQFADTYKIQYNYSLNQYLTLNNQHIKQTEITFNGDTSQGHVNRGAGYLNWIADYLTSLGINPATKITPMLKNFQVNLAYKMAGFSDKKYLQILAEQSSPSSTNASVMIPDENYEVLLYKSTPVDKLVYSAVIVEKNTNGYSVRGYDINNPYFTIIPSIVNNNRQNVSVLNGQGIIYGDYERTKITVPYGYEFISPQQVVDFLISYERYLLAQGFTFNDLQSEMGEVQNWRLAAKEFLFWSQQGWKPGAILVLSPVANSINAITVGSIVDGIEDSQYGSKVVDQNFNLIKNTSYNVMRTPTEFKLTLLEDTSVIAFVELNLVQYEHVLVFDNTTVFNDVVYKPELGNRQFRLKLIGQKTDNWDGSLSAPGFIYNSKTIQAWVAGKDYLKGDLVTFKNQYYVALQNTAAANEFGFVYWKQLTNSEIQVGLLNDFSTIAVGSQSFYDSYGYIQNDEQLKYSHGLIGFKPRQYLDDLGMSETTQIELYKGYIKQKGSKNAIDALADAVFNDAASSISYFEEWAVRTGEYGALGSNPYVELALDEKAFSVNPATAKFVGITNNNEGDGVTVFNKSQLFRSTDQYDGNIALVRDEHSNYDNDIPLAGYVNIDDVDTTIFDLANYTLLDTDLENIGSGYTIWTAKDFSGNWNVYRISETNNFVVSLVNELDDNGELTGYVIWETQTPHGLRDSDIFLVRTFNPAFNGFYQIDQVLAINQMRVVYLGAADNLDDLGVETLTGLGLFYKLDSLRFLYMEDSRIYGYNGNPKHGWQEGEKIWIDEDAATDAVQGQPFNTPSGGWKVYEKTIPWNYSQTIIPDIEDIKQNSGFGTSVKLSYDGLLAVAGNPSANTEQIWSANVTTGDYIPVATGKVHLYNKGLGESFTEGVPLIPNAGNANIRTSEFGFSVDQSINHVGVGAPGSYGNVGLVYVYTKTLGTSAFSNPQVVWSGNLRANVDRFGSSIAFDENGRWLYVGAPGNAAVYVYGLNTHVEIFNQLTPVGNVNTLLLNASIVANVGDVITQPTVGSAATVKVATGAGGNSRVQVSTLTNIVTGTGPGNIYINGTELSSRVVNSTQTNQVQQTIDLDFVPSVANEANLLVISNPTRTFIPGIDYTLSANTVTFKEKLIPAVYSIEQRPYYALQNILYGPAKSLFGYSMDSSLDGAQLGVGAPNDNVTVNGNVIVGAGAVYVYDRVIEAFETTGSRVYTTTGNIDLAHRVTIDDIEVDGYDTWLTDPVLAKNKVRFIDPPVTGKVVFIESNQFNLLERLIGIDSLVGGLGAIQANAAFGTDLTICSNNCAIYVGAPYYNNYPQYTTGAVWKFHNKGRLYGVNTGYALNPTFIPGDTMRLDNFEITVTGRMMPSEFDLITASVLTGIPEIYASANVLTLSSKILANVGQTISQNLGSGNYANVIVLANTAVTGSQTIIVGGNAATGTYTTTAYPFNFSYSSAANVRIGNVTVTSAWPARPIASLDSLVKDINDADILGVSAVNQNGYLTLISNKTIAKNLLRILSGSNSQGGTGTSNIFSAADLAIFAFMQIIVNPYNAQNEYFGSKVVLAQNAYMLVISSDRGTTRNFTTFDSASTIFDDRSTVIFDSISGSGSVYIYELYDDPRDEVENPGRYAFAQQLNTGSLQTGDRFGTSIDIIGSTVIAGAPADDTITYINLSIGLTLAVGDVLVLSSNSAPNFYFAPYTVQLDYIDSSTVWVSPNSSESLEKGSSYRISILRGGDTNSLETTDAYITDIVENTGSIFIFSNPTLKRGWNLIRYQQPKVDIESVNRMYLYNNLTNTILTNLQFIDPAKGKILGQADQEITYKTIYDPATYNRGNTSRFNINSDTYWGANQVEQVWWNLDQVRFIDYEQGSLVYRSVNWGRLFPGSVIEVCEWVESTVLPSQYVTAGNDGIPKYADNSAYVEIIYVDPVTNIIGSKYYFWVIGKTSVTGNNPKRQLPIQTIADYISNPKSQGISYSAVIDNNAVIVYNVGDYLSASNTILHIDYEIIKNNSIIHSEYELLQKDNPVSFIPTKISNKLIDSLAGIDSSDSVVPDPKLNVADRYGVSIRPRQSMFIDRLRAMRDLVDYVNGILIDKPIARQYDLTQLNTEEEKPNFKLGEYDLEVDTEIDLDYIDITNLEEGYKVLVNNDTTQDNLWVLYKLDADKQWIIDRVQSYKTDLYWDYVDWFAYKPDGITRYSLDEKLDFVVPTIVDAKKLSAAPGEEILVRVSTGSIGGGWNLLVVNELSELVLVGIENGTIQLKTSLGNFADNGIGFDAQGYTTSRFDQNPNKETRYILSALKDDIFVDELQGEYNKLFFVMMNYLFNEQKYVDWIFKTSFISITHFLRELAQPANYIKDNITYYEEYINEVKPYITKIREYLTNYKGTDVFEGGITDFDLPAYYDPELDIFRSPSGKYPAKDQQLWATGYLTSTGQLINQDYPQWYSNRHDYVAEIIVEEAGAGYTSAPIVYVSGGTSDEANYALATAHVNYSLEGEVVLSSAENTTGEGLSRVIITSPGAGYSQGTTANVEAAANGGVRANVDITIFESNGQIATATVSEFGTNYLTVPFVTVVKPPAANVAVTAWSGNLGYTNISFSGNIVANIGQVISQDLGSGYYANALVKTNSIGNTVSISYVNANVFVFSDVALTVNIGSTVTVLYPQSEDSLAGNILTVSTTAGIFVGMRTNIAAFGSSTVTNVFAGNSKIQMSRGNTSTVGTNISFYDQGAGAELTALLTETYLGLYPTHLENDLVILSGNVTALVGEVIYQPSTGARSIITANVINTDRFPVSYLDANVFALGLPAGRITSISVDYQGRGYVTTPMVIINGGNDVEARAYAVLKNNQVRTFDTTIKFDRISYGTTVEQWTSFTTYTANTIVSYQGQGYLVSNTITTGTEFITSDYTLYDPSDFNNANDRIMAYYSPKTAMPAKDLNQLIPGIEYPGVQVQGLNFSQGPGYSGETTANVTFNSAVSLAVGDLVSQITADTIIKLSWPISATVGSYIYQPSTGANAIIYGENILGGNVVESSTVYLIKSSGAGFNTSGNITIGGVLQTTNQIVGNVLTSVEIKPQTVNIGSASYVEIPISTPSFTVTKIWSPTAVQGIINTTADFVFSNTSITSGNIDINGITSNVYPTALDYVSSADDISAFDENIFDQVDYDEDGNPILSEATVDSLIRSYYTDEALGTRPEDINVDGGAYIDRYSSHAPEELIPGIIYDTLDMRVFTNVYGNVLTLSGNITVNVGDYIVQPTTGANALVLSSVSANSRVTFSYVANSNVFVEDTTTSTVNLIDGTGVNPANVTSLYVDSVGTKLAYRLFKNMMGYHNYVRISDRYATNLSRELLVDDTEIHVVNALNLPGANPTLAIPGVVYINGERITYYRNYALDVVTWQNNTNYDQGSILNYGNVITFSGAITANRGDYITQASGNANVMITANVTNQTNVSVYYTSANTITFGSGIVEIVSGPNTANVTTTTVYPTASYPAYYKSTGNVEANTFNYFNVEPIASLNVLSQIRRGTQGTGAANVYPLGALVIDGSQRQNIPDTALRSRTGVFGEVQLVTADEFVSTNSNISLNSENNLVTNISTVVGSSIIKAYVGQTGNIGNLYIGDSVTGFINNTTVSITSFDIASNVLTVGDTIGLYVGMRIFDSGFDAATTITSINDPELKVTLSNANTGAISATVIFSEKIDTTILAIRNVYRNTDSTTVSLDANITVTTANIWLNPGDNIVYPADGTGFEGSLSVPVQFLKELTGGRAAYAASLGDAILQEGTNLIALLDESGNAIIIE